MAAMATAIPSFAVVLALAAAMAMAAAEAAASPPPSVSGYGWGQYGDHRQRRDVGSVAKTAAVVAVPSWRGRTARQRQRCYYYYNDDGDPSSPLFDDNDNDRYRGGGGGRCDSDGRDGTDAAQITTRIRGGGGGGEDDSNRRPGEDEVTSATASRGTRRRGRRSDGDDSRGSGRIRRSSKRHRGGGDGGESAASASGTEGGTTTTATALTAAAGSSTSSNSNGSNSNPKQQQQQQQQDFVGVTILCWGDIPTAEEEEDDGTGQRPSSPRMAFAPGCQLLSASPPSLGAPVWIGRGSWDDDGDPDGNDRNSAVALWKTVAFLSDVVVLVCRRRQPIPPALVQALEAGLTARLANRVPKGRLLMVLQCPNPRELRQWKSALERDLSRAVPGILQELRVVGDSEYRPTLRDMMRRIAESPFAESRGLCALVDGPSVVPALFRQVHRAFGGPDKKDLFRRQTQDLVTELAAPPPTTTSGGATAASSPGETTAAAAAAALSSPPPAVGDVEDMLQSPELVELERRILELSDSYLNDVQKQQEACWLENRVPINFASVVNTRLSAIQRQLKQHNAPMAIRTSVRQHVAGRVQQLYLQQLEALREQYGKMYESILDRSDGGDDDPDAWKDAASRVAERFRNAAERAVPPLCRPGKFFCPAVEGEGGPGGGDPQQGRQGGGDVWHYHRTVAESGLISDLMESTELRTDAIDLATEGDDVDDGDVDDILQDGDTTPKRTKSNRTQRPRWLPKRVRIRPWQRKFLARALVLGVNYVQGWLAWQGIKRAALLREQQMPKFPLF